VLVGEPVPVEDLLGEAERAGWSEHRLQVAIADRVGKVGGSVGGLVAGSVGGSMGGWCKRAPSV